MAKSTWIDIRAGLNDFVLEEHRQPYGEFSDLVDADAQAPQMIMLVGGVQKTASIPKLGFGTARTPNHSGDIRLSVDPETTRWESPLLIADCELHVPKTFSKIIAGKAPLGITRRSLTWQKRMPLGIGIEPKDISNLFYTQIMLPFSTLICFFAEDFRGLGEVATLLATWLVNVVNCPPDLPNNTQPRIMILVKENNSGELDEKTVMPQFLRMLFEEAARRSRSPIERTRGRISPANMAMLFSHFGNIRILALPQPQSSHREWKAIRKQILDESECVCVERSKAQFIFSATHLTSLFSFACDHFCGDVVRPFNFIRASRLPSPVPKDMATHLSEFMSQVDSVRLHTFAVPIIASALALDAYPPEMHIFNPRAVFDELYKQICQGIRYHRSENAEENAFDTVQLTNAIEHQFCQNVLAIAEGKTSAAAAHQSCLYYFREEWAQIRSATTCFGCVVARRPEHTCSCGHTFCDLCLVNYGRGAPGAPWTISIKLCPLCDVEVNKVVKLKPPTAGVRVFTADGGGVRGVVGIRWLKVLESNVRLPMPIQEHFDLVVGTSSGGLTGWGLSGEGWSVEECDNKYETLSGVAFHTGLPPQLHSIGVIQMIRHIIVSCTTGSRYSSSGIKKAICSSFGEDAVLFGNATSTKIAITATTTDKSSTVIFTNYNGPQRPAGCGYTTPSGKEAQGMKVWEVARATSAAPPYFKPYKGYHDGGLGGHNNPVNLALWEQDLIWDRKGKQPDFVLSLGTGSAIESDSGDTEGSTNTSWISQLFLPRLFRSFMKLLDGQKTWLELLNSVPQEHRSRYHRFTLGFHGPEPKLDDVNCMQGLRERVDIDASLLTAEVRRCIDNILASLFYLELDCLPLASGFSLLCHARILCRLDPGTRELRALLWQLKESQARFYVQSTEQVPCVDQVSYTKIQHGEPFCTQVEFCISSMDDLVDVKVDGITQRARSISNCPYKLLDLVKDQCLHRVFGRPDHKRRLPLLHHAAKRRKITRNKSMRRWHAVK